MSGTDVLGDLSGIATALGVLDADGELETQWLRRPGDFLRTVLAAEHQREALVEVLDELLGGSERRTDAAGRVWLPLVGGTGPDVTLSLVLDDDPADHVRIGIGVELRTSSPTSVTTAHLPLFRASTTSTAGSDPLLLGTPDGRLQLGTDITVDDASPTPGQAHLAGVAVEVDVPTGAGGADPVLGLTLRGLQLPGAAAPRDVHVSASDVDDLDDTVLELVLGLLEAQAEAVGGPVAAVAGILGLRTGVGVPPLPLEDLATSGVAALAAWFRDVADDAGSRGAWLGQLAEAVGGTVADDAVVLDVGDATVAVGVRVTTDAGGHPVVVPHLRVALDAGADVRVQATADVARLDLGPGTATALPAFAAYVELGRRADGGGTPLVTGDPGVEALRAGVVLDAQRRPTFLLSADRVVVAGHRYPHLDLTDADALAETAETLLTDVVADLLARLGPVGDAVAELLGVRAPTGHPAVPTVDLAAFLADPLDAVRDHWHTLLTSHADAVPDLLTGLRDLLADAADATTAVAGSGTEADPWRVPLVGPVHLAVHHTAGVLHVAVAAAYDVDTLGQRCTVVSTRLTAEIARLDLAAGSADLLAGVTLAITTRGRVSGEAQVDLGDVTVVAEHLALLGRWTPSGGLTVRLDAPGLALRTDLGEAPIVLPTVDAGGAPTLDAAGWRGLEALLGLLIEHGGRLAGDLDVPPVPWLADALDALGWARAGGPRLSLEAAAADLHAALAGWLSELLAAGDVPLDALLQSVGRLLAGSASSLAHLTGTGRPADPYLVHLDAVPGRPALVAWAVPDGPPLPPSLVPDEVKGWLPGMPGVGVDLLVDALEADARLDEATAGLLGGRTTLTAGLRALTERWVRSDGLIVPPSTDVPGTVVHRLPDLVAADLPGAVDLAELLGAAPDTVVRVAVVPGGVEPWPGAPRERVVDLRTPGLAPEAFPVPAVAAGEWFVALADPDAARLAAGDPDGSAGQAARLTRAVEPFGTLPGQLAVVAEGGAGHAARAAATALAGVDAVVTLGTPLGPVAFTVLDAPPAADALRLLAALLPPEDDAEPDDADLRRARRLTGAMLDLLRLPDPARDLRPPAAGTPPTRTGLANHAVFGVLTPDGVARALTAAVAADLSVRASARFAAPTTVPTGVRFGLRLPVHLVEGTLVAEGHAVVELGGVDLLPAPAVVGERSVRVHLDLRREGGWLLGGPDPLTGLRPDHELRRLEADVLVPLGGTTPQATARIVLHEPTTFGARRARWVVAPGTATTPPPVPGVPAESVTPALPEVRVLLSGVAGLLAPVTGALRPVTDLLTGLGLLAGGGSVPDAVDTLLHDPAAHVGAALEDPAARALLQSALDAALAPLGVTLDLAARSLAVTLASTAGLAAWDLTASVTGTRLAAVTASVGTAGSTAAGGLEVTLSSATGRVDLVSHRPGRPPRTLPLWPTPDTDALLAALVEALPAELGRMGLEALRRLDPGTRPLVDAVLDALGLLGAPTALTGDRGVVLPFALLHDPAGWFSHPTVFGGTTGLDAAKVAAFVDALKPVLGVTGAPGRWDLAPGVAVAVGAPVGALDLELSLDTTVLDADPAAGRLRAAVTLGLTLGTGAPTPRAGLVLGLPGATAGRPAVHVALAGTSVTVALRPTTGADIPLHPDPPGLGRLAEAAVTQALPLVLDELATRTGTDLAGQAGAIVRTVGDALALRTATDPARFDGARLTAFAADPVRGLVDAVPTLTTAALTALADALGDVLPAGAVATVVEGELRVTVAGLTVGWQPSPLRITVGADVHGIPLVDAVAATVTLDATGLAALVVQVGPGDVDTGGAHLRPLVGFAVGTSPPGGRRVDLALAVDAAGTATVGARWDLDAGTVTLLVDHAGTPTTDPGAVAGALLDVLLDLAAGFLLGTTAVTELLDRPVGGTTVRNLLRGAVLEDVADPAALDDDLFDPDRLLARVQRLLVNLAGTNPTLTVPGGLTVGLARSGDVVQLVAGIAGRADLTTGDVVVSVEADSRWIRGAPPAGLAVGLVDTSGDGFAFAPSLACHGLGLRISRGSGPLLDTVVTLGSAAVHLFGSIGEDGIGAGVQVQLSDLAVSTGGAGGGNAIASGLLADADASGEELAPAFSPAVAVQKHPDTGVLVSLSAGEGAGPWWLSIQSGFGPLYVEQVGLGVTVDQEQIVDISLLLDARVSLFGLTAAVDDLQITYTVTTGALAVDLAGLAIAADVSGISLAGALRKFGSGDTVEYVGMLMGRFAVYGLSVYGGYGTGVQDGERFASFFAFGAVVGPIGGPPAFFVTGIGGGIGINRGLVLPTDLSRVGDFPLLKALDPAASPSPDPMAELAAVRTSFPVQRGQFWFAGGISFTSFALVDGIAVVAIEVGDGLEIALLGLARMALPRPQVALVSIELGLVARFSSKEGVLWIQAQLTDNSWLLHESVRLTGGFAFVTWFTGARAGEFVLTMGGYHPSFHRDGYPQVPRLGYRWQVSTAIVIKGESYFALTSEALMAGGSFEASAKLGPAWASITFGADGIVYFDPFRFEVTVYARISAGVTIDVWIGEITIRISIGARITVAGPKIRGTASFEIGPVDVTFAFGDTAKHPKVFVSWAEFTTKYLEEASPGVARVLSSIPGRGAVPPGTGPSGSEAGTADGSAAHPWEVLSEFELTVVTTVPTRTFHVADLTRTVVPSSVIGVAPVNIGSATTELRLNLMDVADSDLIGELDPGTPLVGSFPAGVWGPPQPDEDKKIPEGEVIAAGNGITLHAVARLQQTLPPEIAYHQVETGPRKPLPLIAEREARPDLVATADELRGLLPQPDDPDALLAVAGQWLAGGGRSATAVAALAGDRVAVPLLGSLTEGLAAAEGSTPDLSLHDPTGRPEVDAAVRAPVAVAVLSAATPALRRRVRTSVRDPREATVVRPPRLAEVRALAEQAVPLRLSLVGGAAVPEGTMLALDHVPLTRAAVGSTAAVAMHGGEPGARARLDRLTVGLTEPGVPGGPAVAGTSAPSALAAGELAVLALPNARRDVAATRTRPRLVAEGGPVRMLALGFGGEVLAEVAGRGDTVDLSLPPQTERVVALSEGEVDPEHLAGWHAGQEVAFVGWATAVVPGATLALEGATVSRHRQRRQAGWIEAAELVAGAEIVRTTFTEPVRTVVVVLDGAASGGDPVGLDLALTGATADGPPTLVASGNRSLLVYAVRRGDGTPVTVSVANQSAWTVAGVLAARGAAASVAASLRTGGLDRLVRPFTGPSSGAPVLLSWRER